ncbi:transglutaminase domain-containing protein [Faecalimonas sp.]
MKRKKIWLTLGIMVSAVSISVTTIPNQREVYAKTEYMQTMSNEKKNISPKEYNRLALEFVKSLKPDTFKTWDQSIAKMTEEEAREIKSFLDQNIIKNEKDDYQKAKKIYEWIMKNIRYARPQDQNVGLRPYDVFKYKVAVCGGYSNLYKAMLNLEGIPSVLVTGNTSAGAHEWNMVYANGKWFFSDSTWGSSDEKWFDYGFEQFAKDHMVLDVQQVFTTDENGVILGFHKGMAVIGVKNGIKTLTVPKKYNGTDVTSVAYTVFDEKYALENIILTEKVTNVDVESQSKMLKSIKVPQENTYYASKDGVLFTKDFSRILMYPFAKEERSFVIPKEVREYDSKETFKTPQLGEILVEEGNKTFSSYDGAIYNKEKTMLLTVPEGKNKIYIPGTVVLDNIALNGKQNLKEVILEDGMKNIPPYTFSGCTGLKKIYIPASVTNIAKESFNAVDLKEVIVCGQRNSEAEKFAKINGMKFEDVKALEIKLKETKEVIAKAKEFEDVDKYTEESVEILRKVINEAEKTVQIEGVTVEELDRVIEKLNTTISAMEEKIEPEKPQVSKEIQRKIEEVNTLLKKAEKYDNTNKYTEESIAVLRKVIKEGKVVVAKENVTVEELDTVIMKLNKSIAEMKEVEIKNPPKDEKPQGNMLQEEQGNVPKTADTSVPGIAGLGGMVSMAIIAFLQKKKR